MIRFAWRSSRAQTLTVVAALAALAVAASITGIQLSHLYHSLVVGCRANCNLATDRFLSHGHVMEHLLDLLAQAAPALFGIFWGAPLLARELETGTYRLAWTQSVTRRRWLLTKLGLVALATVTAAGLLTLTITWWYRAMDPVSTTPFAVFDRRDIVPIAYATFAVAVGALLGAVLRRTVPAMAGTLVVFVLARIAVTLWVRPHLLPPLHRSVSLLAAQQFGIEMGNGSGLMLVAGGGSVGNGWTLSSRLVTASGHPLSAAENSAFLHHYCGQLALPSPGGPPPDPARFRACTAQAARLLHLEVSYQPASRYWAFQGLESGIFVALALLAAGATYRWVTRRAA